MDGTLFEQSAVGSSFERNKTQTPFFSKKRGESFVRPSEARGLAANLLFPPESDLLTHISEHISSGGMQSGTELDLINWGLTEFQGADVTAFACVNGYAPIPLSDIGAAISNGSELPLTLVHGAPVWNRLLSLDE